jgi:hypothetical protein
MRLPSTVISILVLAAVIFCVTGGEWIDDGSGGVIEDGAGGVIDEGAGGVGGNGSCPRAGKLARVTSAASAQRVASRNRCKTILGILVVS